MNEKNLKLLEIAGFKKEEKPYYPTRGQEYLGSGYNVFWVCADGHRSRVAPDLYNSLDALFKWVVPKLSNTCRITLTQVNWETVTWVADFTRTTLEYNLDGHAGTPAHALAEAILKAWEDK